MSNITILASTANASIGHGIPIPKQFRVPCCVPIHYAKFNYKIICKITGVSISNINQYGRNK